MNIRTTAIPRMKDVADRSGVAPSTVSMALSDSPEISEDTKEKVRAVCRELGYPLDRHSSSRRYNRKNPRRLGFLAVDMRLEDPSLSSILHTFAGMGSRDNLRIEIAACETEGASEKILDHIYGMADNVDGVIVFGMVARQTLERLRRDKIPAVLIGTYPTDSSDGIDPGPPISMIHSDETGMGRMATQFLRQEGHERIGFICCSLIEGMYDALWRDGYYLGLLDTGLPPRTEYVFASGYNPDAGKRIADHFLSLPELPTAYVIPDAYLAMHLQIQMERAGHPIRNQDIVLGANPTQAEQVGMGDCLMITPDYGEIARAAVELFDLPPDMVQNVMIRPLLYNTKVS